MSTRALVIGIDAYTYKPLTSAVNDARAFRDALIELELVNAADITLLTSPAGPDARGPDADGPATFDGIVAALRGLYRHGADIDRLYLYFAGHGLLAFGDAAQTQAGTALMPADLHSLKDEANKLILVDEVHNYLRRAGPVEQLYFIDACRDLPYEKHPRTGSLGWDAQPPLPDRGQATLYAVSELGRAGATPHELGYMSKWLVRALHGAGTALDYDPVSDEYMVTMESVRNYVHARIKQDLTANSVPQPEFMLPQLISRDPSLSPIRFEPDPPERTLTVHIQPDTAADETEVVVRLGRGVPEGLWPPNHNPISLQPRMYRLCAQSSAGVVDPQSCPVDVREQDEAIVRVSAGPPGDTDPDSPKVTVAPPPRLRSYGVSETPIGSGIHYETVLGGRGIRGRLEVDAVHELVAIDVIGLEPPYERHQGLGRFTGEVALGGYRVDFRLGPQALASTSVYVAADEEVSVEGPRSDSYKRFAAGGHLSPVQLQMLGLALFTDEHMPWDLRMSVEQFRDRAMSLRLPLVVVTSDERRSGPKPFEGSVAVGGRPELLRSSELFEKVETPYGVAGLALVEAAPAPFELRLDSAGLGGLDIASVALEDRVTVLTLRTTGDGRLDASQSIFHHRPGQPRHPFDATASSLQTAELLYAGQQLYKSGELMLAMLETREIERLLYGKWADPILGCMGIYASETNGGLTTGLCRTAARNLLRYFGDLPDAVIAASLVRKEDRERLLDPLLEGEAMPLLTHSTALLAAYAVERGRERDPIVERRARIPHNQAWNIVARDRRA